MKKVVLIFAHPDDAEISCYGTIRNFIDLKKEVHLIILTNGIYGISTQDQEAFALKSFDNDLRKHETLEAFDNRGLMVHFMDIESEKLLVNSEIITKVEKLTKTIDPDILITHFLDNSGLDHQEHVTTANIVLNLSVRLSSLKLFLLAEPIQSYKMTFLPNFFIDITQYFEEKCDALQCHKSQLGRFYLSRPFHLLRGQRNALSAGLKFFESKSLMEGFYSVKQVYNDFKLDDR